MARSKYVKRPQTKTMDLFLKIYRPMFLCKVLAPKMEGNEMR